MTTLLYFSRLLFVDLSVFSSFCADKKALAGTVVPQPQKPSASDAVKKASMRKAFCFFLSAQKEENSDKFSNKKMLKYNRVVKIIMYNKS